MPTYANDALATRALATRLTTVFTVTNAANYTGAGHEYGGVDVVLAVDEDTEEERVGKPYLLIDLQQGMRSAWSAIRAEYRALTVMVAACANDSSGAQSGNTNPITSPELMSRDLIVEIKTNNAAWNALGLEGIEVSADKAVLATAADSPGTIAIPHRVTFHYEVTGV